MAKTGSTKRQSPADRERHAECTMENGIRAYWGEHSSDSRVDEYLCAAGELGGGAVNRKIGDFYRFEFSENNAQIFYVNALRKDLEEAEKGNADAMFALAEQYAIGLGVPQDSEKAGFWLQEAARHGSREAEDMMVNLWQDGSALPISAAMAGAWKQHPQPLPRAGRELETLRAAAVRKETAAERYRVTRFLREKNLQACTYTNLADTPEANRQRERKERFRSVSRVADQYIILAVLLCLLITRFTGYRETGIFHFTGLITYVFLLPVFAVFALFRGGADLSMQALCGKLYMNLSWTDIEAVVTETAISIFYLLLMLLWLKLFFRVVNACISPKLNKKRFTGVVFSDHRAAIDPEMCKEAASAARKAEQQLQYLLEQYGLERELSSPAALLALYDYAAFSHTSSVCAAVAGYRAMQQRKEKPSLELRIGDSRSPLVHFFFMNRTIPASKKYAGICANPVYNFSRSSDFMEAYRTYRRGADFAAAEAGFRHCIETRSEIAFSSWYLSRIYRTVHWSQHKNKAEREAHNADCLKKAQAFEDAARAAGCPYAQNDAVSAYALVWQLSPEAIDAFLHRIPYSSRVEEYYRDIKDKMKRRRSACGDPQGDDPSACIGEGTAWAAWNEAARMVRSKGMPTGYSDLSELKRILEPARKAGILRAKELYDEVSRGLRMIDEELEMRAFLKEQQRQERERKVSLAMQEWESQRDEHERTRNAFFRGEYDTDFSLNIRGGMSDSDYYFHDSRRFEARRAAEEEIRSAVYAKDEDEDEESYHDEEAYRPYDLPDSDDGREEIHSTADLGVPVASFDAADLDDDDLGDEDSSDDDAFFDDSDDDFDYE